MKELPVIGFDAKRAAQNRTGLGNYSRFVIRGLAKWVPNLRLYLFTPCAEKTNAIAGIDKLAAVTLHHPEGFFWRHFRALWRQWGVSADAANKKVKLFHGLTGELPWGLHRKGIMSVVTIHDLIFLRYPRYYHLIDRWIYHWKFRSACCRADRIIAVSECTKRDIMHFFGTPEEKISVVYQGCDERFRQPVSDTIKKEVRARYQLPEHYILYVGSIEERKNLMLLAEALPLLKDKNLQVVAVGRRTSYANRIDAFIRSHDLTNRFRMVSGVPSVDLPVFYQLAKRGKSAGATWKDGAKQVESVLTKAGVSTSDVKVADGSGVSLYNYVSAWSEVKMLRYAYRNKQIFTPLYESMPIAGVDGTISDRMRSGAAYQNVHAKTGTVTGVSSLSGYVRASNGNLLAFAIINNGNLRTATGHNFQDRICQILAK